MGFITSLSDEGWVEISYLGTEPSTANNAAILKLPKNEAYHKIESECTNLLEKVNNIESGKKNSIIEKEKLIVKEEDMKIYSQVLFQILINDIKKIKR